MLRQLARNGGNVLRRAVGIEPRICVVEEAKIQLEDVKRDLTNGMHVADLVMVDEDRANMVRLFMNLVVGLNL